MKRSHHRLGYPRTGDRSSCPEAGYSMEFYRLMKKTLSLTGCSGLEKLRKKEEAGLRIGGKCPGGPEGIWTNRLRSFLTMLGLLSGWQR